MISSEGCMRASSRENPWLGAFSTPPDCTSNCEGLQQTQCKDEDVRFAGEEHRSSIVSAGVIPDDVAGSITISHCSIADTPTASTTSLWELNAEPAPQTNPGSSSSASHVHRESGRGGVGDTGDVDGAVEGHGCGVISGLLGGPSSGYGLDIAGVKRGGWDHKGDRG